MQMLYLSHDHPVDLFRGVRLYDPGFLNRCPTVSAHQRIPSLAFSLRAASWVVRLPGTVPLPSSQFPTCGAGFPSDFRLYAWTFGQVFSD